MFLSPRWMQAVLVFWIVLVAFSYIAGISPVYGLIGIIFATIALLVRGFVKKASSPDV